MILLDTHIWVRWLESDIDPLPKSILKTIESADEIGVSVVSCWEVAYLHKRNRIFLPIPLDEWIEASLQGSGIRCLPLTLNVALKAARLPEIHRDPIDRFIIAEAIIHNMTIISLDRLFCEYHEIKNLLLK